MATKKPAATKKGAAFASASKPSASQAGAADRRSIDDASKLIAQAVKRATAGPTKRPKYPIIVGIYYNPRTNQIELINQLEQF